LQEVWNIIGLIGHCEKRQGFESRLNSSSLCDTYPSAFGTLGYAYVGRLSDIGLAHSGNERG